MIHIPPDRDLARMRRYSAAASGPLDRAAGWRAVERALERRSRGAHAATRVALGVGIAGTIAVGGVAAWHLVEAADWAREPASSVDKASDGAPQDSPEAREGVPLVGGRPTGTREVDVEAMIVQATTPIEATGWVYEAYWAGDGSAARWAAVDDGQAQGEVLAGPIDGGLTLLTIVDHVTATWRQAEIASAGDVLATQSVSYLMEIVDAATDPEDPSTVRSTGLEAIDGRPALHLEIDPPAPTDSGEVPLRGHPTDLWLDPLTSLPVAITFARDGGIFVDSEYPGVVLPPALDGGVGPATWTTRYSWVKRTAESEGLLELDPPAEYSRVDYSPSDRSFVMVPGIPLDPPVWISRLTTSDPALLSPPTASQWSIE